MKNYISFLQNSSLFAGFSTEDIQKLCTCLDAHEKSLPKDTFVFHADDEASTVYLLLSGHVHIVDEDFWGNRTIIETMHSHTLFGEAYALSSAERHLVSVVTAEDTCLLEINSQRLFETCAKTCPCHGTLIKNAARILSEKIVRLTGKLLHIARRTMREKILSYLSQCARQAQSNTFTIPYSRQQLADYLCVDRSALSHELSRLQADGVLRYRKNQFELLSPETEY